MVQVMMLFTTDSVQTVAACPHIFQTFEALIGHRLLVKLKVQIFITPPASLSMFEGLGRAVRAIRTWIAEILCRRCTRAFAYGAAS
jgi:hypothetical protein